MLLEKPGIDAYGPITPDEAKHVLSTGLWQDDPALKIVIQDTIRAEQFEASKQFVLGWISANTLYQSPYTARYWEGTQIERANVPFFTVAHAVNALTPQIVNGLFYDTPPFMTQNKPGTKKAVADAIGDLLAYQLEDINFKEEIRLGTINALLFGTSIWKWGWETFTKERKIYKRKNQSTTVAVGGSTVTIHPDDDDIEEELVEEYIDRPTFEHIVSMRHVLVDPGLQVPDIRKAKYVVHRMYMTWNDLDRLRERPGFNIPSKLELLELFLPPKEQVEQAAQENMMRNPLWDARSTLRYEDTTIDPFDQPLEVLERWTPDGYIVVLNKKLVICNDNNPYGVIPFLSVGWWDVPEAFWSLGLGKVIGPEQRLQQGITNTWIDQATLNLNGVYIRVKGKSIPTQSIRLSPGKIVEVDNDGDFKPLERQPAVPEAGEHLTLSQNRVEQFAALGESATGFAGSSGHSNLARTAAGANLLSGGQGNRISDFVEKLATQVIVPFLYATHELNRSLLPPATIRYILSDELQNAYMRGQNDIIEILNAGVRFTISAGAKLQARKNMAQALPIMIQFITNQQTENQLAIQKKKVDIVEVLRMLFEVSDWKNFSDVIVDMNPEDDQRWQQMQPGAQVAAKAQAQQQMQNQAFNQKSQLIDQENIARAGRDVMRQTLEKASMPFAVTGEAGGPGFGSNAG
jgi:hypothetical protein